MYSGTRDGTVYGFYLNSDGLKNCHKITSNKHKELIIGQNNGKVIKWLPENDYYPTLEDADQPLGPTVEELAETLRADRDAALLYSDRYMTPDYPITEEQRQQVLEYRQALRDITLNESFPNVELPKDPLKGPA